MSESVLSVWLLSQHGGDRLHPVHHRDHEGLQIQLSVVSKVSDHLVPGAVRVTGISGLSLFNNLNPLFSLLPGDQPPSVCQGWRPGQTLREPGLGESQRESQ